METNEVFVQELGRIATVTLNRPECLNALNRPLLEALTVVFAELADRPDVDVVILTGEGRAFSAGVDLKCLRDEPPSGGRIGPALDAAANTLIRIIGHMPQVVIAKVNGYCFTGALELALACDIIIAASDAVFGDTHGKFGLRPSWGMSQRLPRAVGIQRARWISYSGSTFSGEQAARWGLTIDSVAPGLLDQATSELAQTISQNSSRALTAIKDLYRQSVDSHLSDGLQYESDTVYRIDDTVDRLSQST